MGEVSVDWIAGKTLTLAQETIFTKIHSAPFAAHLNILLKHFWNLASVHPLILNQSINQSRYDRSGELALIQQFNKGIAVFV